MCQLSTAVRVGVRNNQVISQVDVGDVPTSQSSNNLTVQGTFDRIRRFILEGQESVTVTYDSIYGYPTRISGSPADPRVVDGHFTISLSKFINLTNGGSTQVTEVNPPLVSAALAELDLNMRKWQQQNITDYSIVSDSSCGMCRGSTAIRVDVRNNQVVSQVNVADGLPNQRSDLSVQGAFDSIRSTILEGRRSVRVSYDAIYGYPTSISSSFIDPMIMDGHVTSTFSEFTPLSNGGLTQVVTNGRLIQGNNGYLIPDILVTEITPPPVRVISVLPPVLPPVVAPRTIEPPVISPPYASCQVSQQLRDSVDMMKDNGIIWACVRGQKPTPCHTVELTSQRSGHQFSIFSRATASARVCSQVTTPFAELVALDTSGLGYGDYPVSFYPLHSQGSVVETRFINR